jgi:plastocyanin
LEKNMRQKKGLLKLVLLGAVVLGTAFGILGSRLVVHAQAAQSQLFIIQAGGYAPGNIEALAFAPQAFQVHQGDTVTWMNNGFHNIRFGSEPLPLVVAPEVDGRRFLDQLSSGFPTIQSGAVQERRCQQQAASVPDAAVFSLVIGLEPMLLCV